MKGKNMLLHTLATGDKIHRYLKSIVVNFEGPRKVLSTSPHNGGLRTDLKAVFNNDGTSGAGMESKLLAPTYKEHMEILSEKLDLDPDRSAGISTAAQMENVSVKTESYKQITVCAVVTGGVEVNGGRAGDPAGWDELSESPAQSSAHGTINIMLFINTDLTEGALTRALVTCTEAKTAALQELQAPSRYSSGLATGSGTDGTIIAADSSSDICLKDAGKHCKLGELIGKAVKSAVTEALFLQTGLSAGSQRNVFRRVSRFGISEDSLWFLYKQKGGKSGRALFSDFTAGAFCEGKLLSCVCMYTHLLDELSWGLILPQDAEYAAKAVIQAAGLNFPEEPDGTAESYAGILEHALADFILRSEA